MMLIAAVVSTIAALAFGLLPALRLTSRQSADLMRQSGAGAGAPRLRVGRALVLVQVAISVPLVVGAALFLRTIYNLASVELGFEPRGLIVFRMDPDAQRLRPGAVEAPLRPGAATAADGAGGAVCDADRELPGERLGLEHALRSAGRRRAEEHADEPRGPGVLRNRGAAHRLGPRTRRAGSRDAPRVAVVNETAARLFFGRANPVGQQVLMGTRNRAPIEIVGVAKDSSYNSLKSEKPQGIIYLPYFQSEGLGAMHVALKTASQPGIVEGVRRAWPRSIATCRSPT